jgi:hypothetical protein
MELISRTKLVPSTFTEEIDFKAFIDQYLKAEQ